MKTHAQIRNTASGKAYSTALLIHNGRQSHKRGKRNCSTLRGDYTAPSPTIWGRIRKLFGF